MEYELDYTFLMNFTLLGASLVTKGRQGARGTLITKDIFSAKFKQVICAAEERQMKFLSKCDKSYSECETGSKDFQEQTQIDIVINTYVTTKPHGLKDTIKILGKTAIRLA